MRQAQCSGATDQVFTLGDFAAAAIDPAASGLVRRLFVAATVGRHAGSSTNSAVGDAYGMTPRRECNLDAAGALVRRNEWEEQL